MCPCERQDTPTGIIRSERDRIEQGGNSMSIFPTRILLATDGSSEAQLPATTAADLARRTDSELHVVHVGELRVRMSLLISSVKARRSTLVFRSHSAVGLGAATKRRRQAASSP